MKRKEYIKPGIATIDYAEICESVNPGVDSYNDPEDNAKQSSVPTVVFIDDEDEDMIEEENEWFVTHR